MFKNRDIICFFGDSITANGTWIAEIYQYLRTKYKIKCFNCGNAGASAYKAVDYLHSNCLNYNPDFVVTMFGINDIVHWLYSEKNKDFPNRQQTLDYYFNLHVEKYEQLIKEIKENGAEIIMCLPVPYDEISNFDSENLFCQARLDEAIEHQKRIAQKYGCHIVDFRNKIMPYLPEKILYNDDRVHPNDLGHHYMAQIFLNEIGEKDTLDFDTPFVYEEWNKIRHDAERKYKPIDYVEFCDIYEYWVKNLTNEEKKQVVRERLEKYEDKTQYIPSSYQKYIDNIDIRQRLVGDVVKLTIF